MRRNVKSAANKPAHVTRGNVLDDLGFSREHATALKFKAELYQAILKFSEKYSQKELQMILGEPQPRVSELGPEWFRAVTAPRLLPNSSEALSLRSKCAYSEDRQIDGLCVCRSIPSQF